MNTVPIGRIRNANALRAPVVVAASAASPSGATITASAIPTTTCVERETTIGQASARSVRRRPLRALPSHLDLLRVPTASPLWWEPYRAASLARAAAGLRVGREARGALRPHSGAQAPQGPDGSIHAWVSSDTFVHGPRRRTACPEPSRSVLAELVSSGSYEGELLTQWVAEQRAQSSPGRSALKESELGDQCAEFLRALRDAMPRRPELSFDRRGFGNRVKAGELAAVSRARAAQGFTPVRDGDVRVLAQEAALRAAAARARQATPRPSPRRSGRPPSCSTGSACTPPRSTRRRARRSSPGSSRRCSSSPRRS